MHGCSNRHCGALSVPLLSPSPPSLSLPLVFSRGCIMICMVCPFCVCVCSSSPRVGDCPLCGCVCPSSFVVGGLPLCLCRLSSGSALRVSASSSPAPSSRHPVLSPACCVPCAHSTSQPCVVVLGPGFGLLLLFSLSLSLLPPSLARSSSHPCLFSSQSLIRSPTVTSHLTLPHEPHLNTTTRQQLHISALCRAVLYFVSLLLHAPCASCFVSSLSCCMSTPLLVHTPLSHLTLVPVMVVLVCCHCCPISCWPCSRLPLCLLSCLVLLCRVL